ncbi:MAG: hypothetical protein ACWA6X_08590 [Bauldia sp.]
MFHANIATLQCRSKWGDGRGAPIAEAVHGMPLIIPMEGDRLVASGTWLYGGVKPMRIEIHARRARYAPTRFNEDDDLDESQPIPDTVDGFIYLSDAGIWGLTLDAAKAAADSQPWGPVTWD